MAHAAPPTGSGVKVNGYVYGAPGIIAIPVGDDDFEEVAEVSYQWGLGGGALIRPGGVFAVGVGLGLEHMPVNVEEDVDDLCGALGDCDVSGHILRLLPEVRLGAALDKVFVYGIVSPGLGLVLANAEGTALGQDFDVDDTDAGFNLGLGAGVSGFVWKRLSVGGELGVDLGFYGEDDDDEDELQIAPGGDDDYGAHHLDIKLLVGWWF